MYYLSSLASRGDLLIDASYIGAARNLPQQVEASVIDHAARARDVLASMIDGGDGMPDCGSMEGNDGTPLLVNMGDVSYVIVDGMICRAPCFEYYCWGGVLMSDLIAALNAAAGAGTARVVLVVDSPGGHSQGMDEVMDAVRRVKAAKPLSAIATGMMCSGAYMLASLADEIVAARRSMVGSIGAYRGQDLIDDTKMLAEQGIARFRIQRPGKMKCVDFGPIDEEIVQAELKRLDECAYQPFREVVVEGRGSRGLTAPAIDAMQGATLSAVAALEMNLIDRIVTPGDFVRETQAGPAAGSAPLVTTNRPGVSKMANDKGPANGPANNVITMLAALSLAELTAARSDVIGIDQHKSAIDDAVKAATENASKTAAADAIASEATRPATIDELRGLCGSDGNLVLSLLDQKTTLKQATDAVMGTLRQRASAAEQALSEIRGVHEKGGGGGADPVGNAPTIHNGGTPKTFQAAAHAHAAANKVSFNAACYTLAADKAMKPLHQQWLDDGCPSV